MQLSHLTTFFDGNGDVIVEKFETRRWDFELPRYSVRSGELVHAYVARKKISSKHGTQERRGANKHGRCVSVLLSCVPLFALFFFAKLPTYVTIRYVCGWACSQERTVDSLPERKRQGPTTTKIIRLLPIKFSKTRQDTSPAKRCVRGFCCSFDDERRYRRKITTLVEATIQCIYWNCRIIWRSRTPGAPLSDVVVLRKVT